MSGIVFVSGPGLGPVFDRKAESVTAEAMTGDGRDGDGPFARLVVARLRWALSGQPGQAAAPPGPLVPPAAPDSPDSPGPPVDLTGLAQGGAAEALAPGAALTALADRACDPAVLGTLTDDQLLGVVAAGCRLAGHAAWIWQAAVAEFAARRREPDPVKATPLGFTPFAPDELAPELAVTANSAELLMAQSRDAARRLPASFALLRDGKITEFPMKIIAESAQCLSDQDAAEADRLIAVSAPGLTPAQLRRLCARIVRACQVVCVSSG